MPAEQQLRRAFRIPGVDPVKRGVWLHRGLAILFVLLAIPAVLWWKQSILFVILLSLATQVSTEFGAAAAADDREVADRLDRIEHRLTALLEREGPAMSDEMPFSLDWLAGAAAKVRPLAVCEDGHLVVQGRTHWSPVRFSPDLKALYCRVTTHEEST